MSWRGTHTLHSKSMQPKWGGKCAEFRARIRGMQSVTGSPLAPRSVCRHFEQHLEVGENDVLSKFMNFVREANGCVWLCGFVAVCPHSTVCATTGEACWCPRPASQASCDSQGQGKVQEQEATARKGKGKALDTEMGVLRKQTRQVQGGVWTLTTRVLCAVLVLCLIRTRTWMMSAPVCPTGSCSAFAAARAMVK